MLRKREFLNRILRVVSVHSGLLFLQVLHEDFVCVLLTRQDRLENI